VNRTQLSNFMSKQEEQISRASVRWQLMIGRSGAQSI